MPLDLVRLGDVSLTLDCPEKLLALWVSPGTDVDFADDMGMDLTDLQALSGFLMNESPDISGHFYPPWAGDTDAVVKDEPVPAEPMVHRTHEQAPTRAPLVSSPDTKVGVSSIIKNQTDGFVTNHPAPRPALKTSAGGITRRRSSSKEEQAKKRRERNRVLARRTRLRKKFFFQSLQQQVRVELFVWTCKTRELIPPTLVLPHMTGVSTLEVLSSMKKGDARV